MQTFETVASVRQALSGWRLDGDKIGFVPTMGALHEGHLSLVDCAREVCDRVVVSIFVNPLQFGPSEDLDRYPRDLERDSALLSKRGVDLLYFPSPEGIYSPNHQTRVRVDALTKPLCGASREGHFEGVTTVVCILLNQVQPHAAFFGLKDYQQYRVIQKMVDDLQMNVEVVACPIIREEDGLALSSRNTFLTSAQRSRAATLFSALSNVKNKVQSGCLDVDLLLEDLREQIEPAVDRIDYLEIRDSETLEILTKIEEKSLCAVAVFMGKTRLIDNVELTP
jgi:pantoate--beta-alanine ligase